MKIIVDIFGGDNAPAEIIKGCAEALKAEPRLSIVMSGAAGAVEDGIREYNIERGRVEVIDAPDVITNDDVPTDAVRRKKDSSLVRALTALKERDDIDGMVSAGSTGAVLAGAIFKVGRIKGIERPALAPLLPTADGREVCLIDCGANVDSRPEFLARFALLGASYMRAVYGLADPRVGLVSNGVEDKKGNELTRAAFALLKEMPVNFVGNMEARDALSGNFDVLVCDGFVGNVLMKSVEGTAALVMKMLKGAVMKSAAAKFGALFMRKAFKSLKRDMDYNSKGGAPLLGVEKIIVKSHGSSKSESVKASVLQAVKMAEGDLIGKIKAGLNAGADK
ncbi:MAG: phosphate acyltransferase PlsX [Clostridiales bacterium]|jgi:glycerol-3-phosphate acyltransferase PlsX|nr:phosphate acyltransferase PlsX [Clostridiales bacterium]